MGYVGKRRFLSVLLVMVVSPSVKQILLTFCGPSRESYIIMTLNPRSYSSPRPTNKCMQIFNRNVPILTWPTYHNRIGVSPLGLK